MNKIISNIAKLLYFTTNAPKALHLRALEHKWYRIWHGKKYHKAVHFLVLGAYILSIITGVINVPQNTYAVWSNTANWTTKSDFENNLTLTNVATSGDNDSNDANNNDNISLQSSPATSNTIASGNGFSLAVKTDGSLWGIGYNGDGALGLGNLLPQSGWRNTGLNNVKEVSTYSHSLILKNDGTVWASGVNTYGQLGDGSTSTRSTFVQGKVNSTTPLTNIKKVITSEFNSFAISNDNKLFAVGWNGNYEMGTGSNTINSYSYWQEVVSAGQVIDVAPGSRSVLILKYNDITGKNEVWGLGNNQYGELGLGHNNVTPNWTKTSAPDNVISIASGVYNSAIVVTNNNDDRAVYTTGMGADYRLGIGDSNNRNVWTLTGINKVNKLILGVNNMFAFLEDGSLWVVGGNTFGGLGVGDRLSKSIWVKSNESDIKNIASGAYQTTLFLKKNGNLYGAGHNSPDIFPTNKPAINNTYINAANVPGATAVDTSYNATAYVKNGYAYASGMNWDYRLGFADGFHKESFTQLPISNVSKIEISEVATYVIKSDKTLWGVGINSSGQLGVGSTSYAYNYFIQSKVDANNYLTNVEQVSAGQAHALALTSSGDVYAVGYNNYGQVGDGTTTNATYWKLVTTGASKIYAGRYSSVVLKSDGTLLQVGYNGNGQYGIGTTTVNPITTWTTSSTGVLDLYGGQYHNFIKKSDGIYAAGYNGYGNLGDGTATQRATWVKINSLDAASVINISSNYYTSAALYNNGSLYSTGHNYYGQLGLGDNTNRSSFSLVPVSGVSAISLGQYHSALYKNDGSIMTVGQDYYGQLGVGRQIYSDTLVQTMDQVRQPSPYILSGSVGGIKFDAGQNVKWVNLLWNADVPIGSALKFRAKGASSEADLATAQWGSYITVSGSNFDLPISRWLELEIVLQSSDGTFSPTVNNFSVMYYTDIESPTNPVDVSAWTSESKQILINNNAWNNSPTPYFEWTGATDTGGSSVKGYWVYFGTDSTADPKIAGIFQSGNSYKSNLSNVDSGKTYYLCVSTEDYAGNRFIAANSPYYQIFTYKFDNTIPNILSTNINVSPVGWSTQNNFSFTWSPVDDPLVNGDASNIAGYQYKIGNGSWSATTTDRVVNNIQAYQNGKNVFSLKAFDDAGNESQITEAYYYYNADAPSKPQGLTVSPQSSTNNLFDFSWDNPASFNGSIKGYYYSVNALPTKFNSVYTTSQSTGPIAAATQQSFNDFYVVAIDNTDNVNWGNYETIRFECNTPAPGPPTAIEIFDTSNRDLAKYSIALNWVAPIDKGAGFSGYSIERSEDGVNFSEVGSSSGTSYIDTGLQSKVYYYQLRSKDNSGNFSAPSTIVNLKPTGKYTSAPRLTVGPEVTTKVSTADIRWITDREASSFIEIGEDVKYGLTQGQFEFTTDHKVRIERLKPDTIYHYRVKYVDIDGNIGYSQDDTLKTQPAPRVAAVNINDVRLNSAVITWNTTAPAEASILYGKSANYGGAKNNVSGGFTTNHSVILDGLDHSSTYHFAILIKDIDGNEVMSDDYTFDTQKYPKISVVRLEPVRDKSTATVKFTWQTNVPTSSIVEYQPTGGVVQEAVKSRLETAHEIIISSLFDNTYYKILIKGQDQFGNVAVSDEQLIKTDYDTRPPQISDIAYETSISGLGIESKGQVVISWQTDEPSTSKVEYGVGYSGNEYSFNTQEDATLSTYHIVVVTGLKPSTTYHFRVVSRDGSTNRGQSEDNSMITEQAKSSILDVIIGTLEKSIGWLFGL